MSNHTPGVWKVHYTTDNAIVGERNGLPECLGQLFDIIGKNGRVTTLANACLIAAAPELFLLVEHLSENPYLLTPDQWQQEANDIFRKYKLSHFANS